MQTTTATGTDATTTYTASTVTPFPTRPATSAAPASAALEEYLLEQNALAGCVDELRRNGLEALDAWTLDEPVNDFAVALLHTHSISA